MLKLGLDTESLHLWFQNKRMDIFGFIEKAHELGLDGVMINLIKDYNLDPEWGTLESADPEHLKKVNSPWIGLHYDFGNSMMVWEEPVKAAENMAPYTFTTHFKDHIVIPCPEDKYKYVVCGVPAGEGNIALEECLDIMLDLSPITRLNVEMCYPYCAQFKRSKGMGGVDELGTGCFKIEEPLYDPEVIKPNQYYYPQEISEELLEKFLVNQMESVEKSVEYTKELCRKCLDKRIG